jgi:cellulose synthase/poly-beta-1,6-N-acetylglucosamine synthase-like glycosyltransferase
MDITIGVCAHNEEGNIKRLLESLESQELSEACIKQIIVVSSGSTDGTDRIVASFSKQDSRVLLIKEKTRTGKAGAINLLLQKAVAPVIVLVSADVLPRKNTIETLCLPLKDKSVGICGARSIPLNSKGTWLGFAVHVLWGLHHRIALKTPKFGECIAFRRVFSRLPDSAVDEEQIASIVLKQGYLPRYVPKAIVANMGPSTVREFLSQRRRIYAGHLFLKKSTGYSPPTMSNLRVAGLILTSINLKAPFKTSFAIALEGLSRLLGYYDFFTGRSHVVWSIAPSTKKLTR